MQNIKNKFRKLENYTNLQEHEEAVDIRGFKVQTASGLILGTVEALIVDEATNLVRYIEVNTKGHLDSPLNAENKYRDHKEYKDRFEGGAHFLLIPIGLATIDKSNYMVNLYGILVANLYTGPRHTSDFDIDEAYEYKVISKYVKDQDSEFLSKYDAFQNEGATGLDNHFYQKDYFQTRRGSEGQPNSPVL